MAEKCEAMQEVVTGKPSSLSVGLPIIKKLASRVSLSPYLPHSLSSLSPHKAMLRSVIFAIRLEFCKSPVTPSRYFEFRFYNQGRSDGPPHVYPPFRELVSKESQRKVKMMNKQPR